MAIFTKEGVARFVVRRSIAAIVNLAIHLDDQAGFAAVEINDIGADRVLAAELHAGPAAAEPLPEQYFRQAHLFALLAGEDRFRAERSWRGPSTALRAVPLPVPGRILDGHHAVHPFFAIHAWQLPLARSRTRPI